MRVAKNARQQNCRAIYGVGWIMPDQGARVMHLRCAPQQIGMAPA
ncbi:hypothetical protein VSX61_09775 [Brenneria populi subsp. brevivirga]|nr:hypothetical protein [Brenneria populi subsp. brevivirga]